MKLPEGFKVEVFIENINTPRQIAQSSSGNLFVGSKNAGIIYAVKNDRTLKVIAKDLKYATGVSYFDGDLYFSEIDSIWKI